MNPDVLRYLRRAVELAVRDAHATVMTAPLADRGIVLIRCMLELLAALEDVPLFYRLLTELGHTLAHGDQTAAIMVAVHDGARDLSAWHQERMREIKAADERSGRTSIIGTIDRADMERPRP